MSHIILDTKDQRILAELDRDARRSNGRIGKAVGLSKEVVKYRVDRLLRLGVILRFHTVVNYFKLGIGKYKLYLRLTNADKAKVGEIAEYFHQHKKTEWVVITTGRWDLIIGFLLHNVNEFDDEVQAMLGRFAANIQEKAVTTTLYLAHHEREFLQPEKGVVGGVVYHTAKDEQERIDDVDDRILRLVVNNARMEVTEIARRLKTTPRIVQYRLRDLEKRNVILAYKAHLNPRAMGRVFCKAIVYLANTTQERLNSFVAYSSSLEGAVWPQRVMGAWDYELDVEAESYDRFQEVLLELKEKFPDVIRGHEFCIVSRELKLDLYPGAAPRLV